LQIQINIYLNFLLISWSEALFRLKLPGIASKL